MRRVDNNAISTSLDERAKNGYHVDSRLSREVLSGTLFSIVFEDQDSFLSLIWQEIDDSRLLTPLGQSRTLKDVATRFIEAQYTFSILAGEMGLSLDQHKPSWFQKCVPIADSFCYRAFGCIAVVLATDGERSKSPSGTFYIFDGVHKTLVLSTLLLTKKIDFQPIEAILLTPRR